MAKTLRNVLFLCTGNSARSIMAESILQKDGASRFRAFSAGSQPKGQVHPLAIDVLQSAGYPASGLRSKSWEEFSTSEAPDMDLVITVCDNAAGESCPIWPGRPVTAHWGIEDPASIVGTEEQKRAAFKRALGYLKTRIDLLVGLPISDLDDRTFRSRVREIGREEGASPGAVQG